MQKETIQKTYQQLQIISSLNSEKQRITKQCTYPELLFNKYALDPVLNTPDELAEAFSQLIKDNLLKHPEYFADMIVRLLRKKQLDQQGLEKIIETFKNHYQLD